MPRRGVTLLRLMPRSSPAVWVLRIFQFFLQNFGNLSQFWWILQNLVHIDFKILEKSLSRLWPHIGTNFLILENFDLANFVISPSYDNHRGGILIFCQIFDFGENRNLESLTLAQIQIWILNPKPQISVLPNLDRSRFQLSNDTKIVKFNQNLIQKFLISQILWVLGCLALWHRIPGPSPDLWGYAYWAPEQGSMTNVCTFANQPNVKKNFSSKFWRLEPILSEIFNNFK